MTLLSSALTYASKELAVGQVGRAMSKLFSNGILPLDPFTQDRIKTKYPAPPLPLPQTTQSTLNQNRMISLTSASTL